MIKRTILEWQKLPYGPNKDDISTIPRPAADKIAAVAATSSLPGPVLEHGRKSLRARGVVGVIAAEGCSLEILPKIDTGSSATGNQETAIRRKLFRMLALALGIKIDVGSITQLHQQDETLLEILIRVFSTKLTEAVRKGMPRRYVEQEDDLPALRGSLDIVRQFTVLAADPSRLACRFDNLSEDTALNQIMKATIIRLRTIAQSNDNQRRLNELAFIYADITETPVSALQWNKVIIDRTNESWRELYDLARLLLHSQYQTTTGGDGRGFALLFEMSALYEEYVGRLLARALAGSGIQVSLQGGLRFCLTDEETGRGLFQTKPDILLKRNNEVVQIIDTKWKRMSPQAADGKQGMAQSDIYQMMAYSQIYHCPDLMLLYPHHAGIETEEGIQGSYRIAEGDACLSTATFDVGKDQSLASQAATIRSLTHGSLLAA